VSHFDSHEIIFIPMESVTGVITEKFVVAVMFYNSLLEVLLSNLDQGTGYRD
jgi:hypothetical protein